VKLEAESFSVIEKADHDHWTYGDENLRFLAKKTPTVPKFADSATRRNYEGLRFELSAMKLV
jgi:hypothetical protein